MTRRKRAALSGQLSLIAPEILVQMLSWARLSGCLVLKRGAPSCRVYLSDGRITSVQLVRGRSSGSVGATLSARQRACAALGAALGWRSGSFTFEPGARPREGVETLDADPQGILLECLSSVRGQGGGDEEGRV